MCCSSSHPLEVHRQAVGWFWDQEIFDLVADHLHLLVPPSLRTYLHAWAALKRMTMNELRDKYAEVHGEPTRAGNRPWLIKKIAWRLQSLAEGDLSERARRRAAELANDADFRLLEPRPPRPITAPVVVPVPAKPPTPPASARLMPGTILTRVYKGETLQVRVLTEGFEFEGNHYASLSAVAKAITGAHWNGRLFFQLVGQGGER